MPTMPTWDPRANDLFLGAMELPDSRERQRYLDGACAGDVGLRAEVEALLEAGARAGCFLEAPAPGLGMTADLPVGERPGTVIGSYKLLEQIGEGGFGTVFMAEQTQPVRRKVALKLIKPGMDTRQVVARFEAERQALALMDHPHIAKVHEAGSTDTGRPYFVMELVRGVPVTDFCDRNHLPVRQRLELFVQVCQAVQHAHQKGVIHRDLKPTNVLVTLHDGVPVAKVIDFGIAKAMGQQLTERTLFTNFAQMVGTPLYMSPEQAEMSGLDVDTRTDIYALGVLLYELLTGTTPLDKERFKTAGYDEIRRIIREQEPDKPSTRVSTLGPAAATISASRRTDPAGLRRLFRGELDWIVMKCLENDRNRRYETAAALVADVRRFLADEPVQACPPSAGYRFRKLARRNRRALVMVSVLALAALVGVGALAASTVLVWKANKDLMGSLDRERRAVDRERREAYFQRITVAHRELSIDNLAAALRALRECPEDLRGWEWYYLMRLCKVDPRIIRDKTEVNGVAFSPDGDRLASAGGDGAVRIWNSRTGEVIQVLKNAHADSVVSVAFHPYGNHVASAGADRMVKVWDLTTEQEVFAGPCHAIRKFGTAYTVAFSPPDGRNLAAGSDGVVRVWDWKNRQLLQPFPGHGHHSIPVVFSPDGRRLVTGGAFGEGQKLWDAEAGGPPLRVFPAHGDHPVSALAFSPDGGQLASAGFDKSVKVWDATTGGLLHTLPHTGNVECVAFSPDGRRLASGGEDKTVHIWDATTGREVLGLRGHTGRCGCVAFSPDGWRLASAGADGTIRFWDATPLRGDEGQEIRTFTQHDDEIRTVAVSPDGRRIASAGIGTLVKVWDAGTGEMGVEFDAHTVVVFGLAWHPDGQRIASSSDGRLRTVQVWNAGDGREVFFALPPGREYLAVPFTAVAFGPPPDGRYLATGKQDGAVQVWDAKTGQEVATLGSHKREVRGVVFSPDHKHLASVSGDGVVNLWDVTRIDAKQEARLLTDRARVPGPSVTVAFSPDGRRLATGGEENTVKIWDVQTGKVLRTLPEGRGPGHRGNVYTVAFSPDEEGRWIASAGEDSTVKIWDSHSGELVRSFRGHTGLVTSLAFSPDGKRLYSGSRDKTVKVWDLTQLGKVPDR
jgi:WD40 repeat protein/serine/threonine protein kinase